MYLSANDDQREVASRGGTVELLERFLITKDRCWNSWRVRVKVLLKGRGEGGGYFNKVSAARPVAMPLGRFNHVMCSEARPPYNQYGIASGTIANVLKSKPKSKLRPKQRNPNCTPVSLLYVIPLD